MTSHKEAPYFYSAVEIPREGFGQLAVDCSQCNGTVVHLDLAKVVSDPPVVSPVDIYSVIPA
jgi:hypothetical protein